MKDTLLVNIVVLQINSILLVNNSNLKGNHRFIKYLKRSRRRWPSVSPYKYKGQDFFKH